MCIRSLAHSIGRRSVYCALLPLLSCDVEPVAPEDSSITIDAKPSTIPTDGGTSLVSAAIVGPTGKLIADGTRVVFTATMGSLCPEPGCEPNQTPINALTTFTKDGMARVQYRGGATPGTATVSAQTGEIVEDVSITLSALTAPSDGEVALVANPSSLAPGGKATITAFLTTANGTPVPDQTRVVFSTSGGSIEPALTLTREGFADAVLTAGPDAGTITVRLQSGALRDSVAVSVVAPPSSPSQTSTDGR